MIAVVGACGPERLRYAKRLAKLTNRAFFPASRLAGSPDPLQEAAVLASWTDPAVGAVVELPGDVAATELIGAFADHDERTRLVGLVCVVDAAQLLSELHRDDYLPLTGTDGESGTQMTARALLTVMQLEYASTIVVAGWAQLPPSELATMMALVSHLSPFARLRLHPRTIEQLATTAPYTSGQSRPGWASVLNGDFAPHMAAPGVGAFRYEQLRPLHPGRLIAVLDRIEAGEFGVVVRSVGFCRLATRPHVTAQWEHVGRMFSLVPLADDGRMTDDEELLAVGQDLAIIGLGLRTEQLTLALDDAALSDAEFAAGPAAWAQFADPFPIWRTADERAD